MTLFIFVWRHESAATDVDVLSVINSDK